MQIFKNILVHQAFDQPAGASIRIAAHLSRQLGSRIKVVDVREDDHTWWQQNVPDQSLPEQATNSERVDSLNALVDQAEFEENVQVKLLDGRPIDAIVNESTKDSHDLILKDAHSQSGGLYFSSLDLRLLRLAPIPVWLADPSVPACTRRILAAIDPHVLADEMHMNERIIRAASMLARAESAELYLVSAWDMPKPVFAQMWEVGKPYDDAKQQVQTRAWENVEHVIDTSMLKIPSDHVIFKYGVGSSTIVAAVDEVQPDLLVMGSVTHRDVPGLLIGNTAEEVSRQIKCSILTLKPDDFTFLLPANLR